MTITITRALPLREEPIRVTSEPFLAHISMSLAAKLPRHRRGTVIDIGCGEALAVKHLELVGFSSYVGVDPLESVLAKAREAYPHLDFRLGDTSNVHEVVTEQCGAFVACCSLHYVARECIMVSLRNIRSVLTVGAYGCIVVPHGVGNFTMSKEELGEGIGTQRFARWNRDTLSPKLKNAGFDVVEASLFNPWSFFVLVQAQ